MLLRTGPAANNELRSQIVAHRSVVSTKTSEQHPDCSNYSNRMYMMMNWKYAIKNGIDHITTTTKSNTEHTAPGTANNLLCPYARRLLRQSEKEHHKKKKKKNGILISPVYVLKILYFLTGAG
jgi:hypothetical protein